MNATEHIELSKFITYAFEWKHMDGSAQIEQKKGKKGKQRELVKVANVDLRSQPYFLQDGDIIGFRLEKENKDGSDDWQTEQDKEDKVAYDLIKVQKAK